MSPTPVTVSSRAGLVVAPHRLAAEAGAGVLREGGNAIEAMIAAASTIAVVYPHMNGLGGDNFWLISHGGASPVGLDACGAAAGLASREFYADHGHTACIPARGPLSALTVAGAVSGWQAALNISAARGGRLPLERLVADSIRYARYGFPVTASQAGTTRAKRAELAAAPGFGATFMPGGEPPAIGSQFTNPKLADTLEHLARVGLDDFYRGDLARAIAADLEASGSPLRLADFERHQAQSVTPLRVALEAAHVYGMPPPTQGLASLMILGLFERIRPAIPEGFAHVHALVEATKQAFIVRDEWVTDPAYQRRDPQRFLEPDELDRRAAMIDATRALPWPHVARPGDTVWLGAIDAAGCAVSFIQSIYWEFGSGVVLPSSGIVWQNRGTSFGVTTDHPQRLEPYRRPFHTIQPAMAMFHDGRVMPYGTMGGEGQPQTQAAIYTRYAHYGQDLAATIDAPRWLLGRTWGADQTNLRIENRFARETIAALATAGHDVDVLGAYDEAMGHAGALVRHPSGLIEGASDPRCDGAAVRA
jgi:oxamate amidohydrolase